MEIGIILTPDERSKAYLQKILKENIHLDEIIFMNDKRPELNFSNQIVDKSKEFGFDISISVIETLNKNNIKYTTMDFVDINHPDLIKHLSKSNTDLFIFTGGGILRNEILSSGPKFIHLHPGIVPQYRGSTCFYYGIINDNECGVTAYFMDSKLDTGDIIYQCKFPKPNHTFVDDVYDSHIRSETLIHVLKNKMFLKNSFIKQNPDHGTTYHIIHPVLKHIAILSCMDDLS